VPGSYLQATAILGDGPLYQWGTGGTTCNPIRGADTQLGDDGDVNRAMGNVMPCEWRIWNDVLALSGHKWRHIHCFSSSCASAPPFALDFTPVPHCCEISQTQIISLTVKMRSWLTWKWHQILSGFFCSSMNWTFFLSIISMHYIRRDVFNKISSIKPGMWTYGLMFNITFQHSNWTLPSSWKCLHRPAPLLQNVSVLLDYL
jgi:hypothetical protein